MGPTARPTGTGRDAASATAQCSGRCGATCTERAAARRRCARCGACRARAGRGGRHRCALGHTSMQAPAAHGPPTGQVPDPGATPPPTAATMERGAPRPTPPPRLDPTPQTRRHPPKTAASAWRLRRARALTRRWTSWRPSARARRRAPSTTRCCGALLQGLGPRVGRRWRVQPAWRAFQGTHQRTPPPPPTHTRTHIHTAPPTPRGNYEVAYTSTARASAQNQRGQPAGGRFRGRLGRALFQTAGVFQSVLRPDVATNKASARPRARARKQTRTRVCSRPLFGSPRAGRSRARHAPAPNRRAPPPPRAAATTHLIPPVPPPTPTPRTERSRSSCLACCPATSRCAGASSPSATTGAWSTSSLTARCCHSAAASTCV